MSWVGKNFIFNSHSKSCLLNPHHLDISPVMIYLRDMSFSHSSTPPKTQRDRKPRILREGRCREIRLAVPGIRTGVGQSRVCPWVPRSGYPIPSVRLAHGCLGWKAHPATAAPCSKVYPSLKDSARLKTKWTSASPVSLTRCNERAGLVTSIQFTHLLTEVENEGPSLSCAACSR